MAPQLHRVITIRMGSITSASYTIQKLESNTVYNITVTVTNAAGIAVSQPIITGQ